MEVEVLTVCQEPGCNVLATDLYCPEHAPHHMACRVGRCGYNRYRRSKFCDYHLYLTGNWNNTYCNVEPDCYEAANVESVGQELRCPNHQLCTVCEEYAIRFENYCQNCICQWPECSTMRWDDFWYCATHKCREDACPERRHKQPAVTGGIVERYCYKHFLEKRSDEWELWTAPYDLSKIRDYGN